jgi:glycosyltransferase involved in cell wall biosynthesis
LSAQKHILIISYTFPPYPGIGGRRWAKFAKYLQRRGYMVHVICSENPHAKHSEWTADIEGIDVHRLPVKYPKSLILFPATVLGKIRYRWDKLIVQLSSTGNYYDRALFWKKQLTVKAEELIAKHRIKNVIATGAPFHILSHTVKLKDVFPDLNVIIDFRDLWAKDLSLSGLASMPENRIVQEIKMEKETVERADHIITVADEMTSYFRSVSKKDNCATIVNGFDEDDFAFLKPFVKKDHNKVKFIYTGNLYNDIDYVFLPFCEAMERLKTERRDLYEQVEFDFYGTYPKGYLNLVNTKGLNALRFHNSIPLPEVLQKINEADYCLLFLNNTYSFSLSTKFCEYIALEKKMVLFSSAGPASEFIHHHQLGHWIDPGNTYTDLLSVVLNKENTLNDSPELRERFSIKNITSELEKYFV